MGTNKKKFESETESESDSESSSSQSSSSENDKKKVKKADHSSSPENESEEEKYKNKNRKNSRANQYMDQDTRKRTHRRTNDNEKNFDTYGHKEKPHNHRHKYQNDLKIKTKDFEGNTKYGDRERSRSKNRDRYDSRHNKDQNEERDRKDCILSRYEGRHKKDNRQSSDTRGKERYKRNDEYNQRRSRSRDKDENRSRFKDNKEERFNRNRRSKSFDHANAKWGKDGEGNKKSLKKESQQKEKPNFGLSGKLTEETNTYKGVVIKYSEPPEARKPRRRWRLYPFKGEKALQTLYIHRQSAYLIGRDRKIADLPVDHPSCSKQHAVLQYRLVPFTRDDGSSGKRVRPYIIDLESANGTFINNKKIEMKKYIELLERDVIKFGFSSREYVLLHENSKDEVLDDDVKQEEEEEVLVKTEN